MRHRGNLAAGHFLAILGVLAWSPSAQACSWPQNLFRDGMRESERVRGSIEVTSVEGIQIAVEGSAAEPTARPLYNVIHGVVTDRRGRKFSVEYQTAILGCSPFTVPEADASGTFYLKPLEPDRYELIHWKAER